MRPIQSLLCSVTIVALGMSSVQAAHGTKPVQISAHVDAFHRAGDATWFALRLRADGMTTPDVSRDHIIAFDTSATQTGEHRQHGFAVLDAVLENLPPSDRVLLLAADIETTDLTGGFVPPAGQRVEQARETLDRRVPLGATRMKVVLTEALELATRSQRPTTVLYIGDGVSTGELIAAGELERLTGSLRTARIPFTSFAVGPKIDANLLGAIAQQTGGFVLADRSNDQTQRAATTGQRLAAALQATVFYPERIRVASNDVKLLPEQALPIRSDRETIHLGTRVAAQSAAVSIAGTLTANNHEISFQSAAVEPADSNAFLRALYRRAATDHGMSVSIAGQDLMNVARGDFDRQVDYLVESGRAALASGNVDQAERAAIAVRELDPGNTPATALFRSTQRQRVIAVAQANPVFGDPQADPIEPPVFDNAPAPANPSAPSFDAPSIDAPAFDAPRRDPLLEPDAAPLPDPLNDPSPFGQPTPDADAAPLRPQPRTPSGNFNDDLAPSDPNVVDRIREEEQARGVRLEALEVQVRRSIEEIKQYQTQEPDAAITRLKEVLESVRATTDIDSDGRISLERRVQNALAEVQAAKATLDLSRDIAAERLAAVEAQRRIITDLERSEEELQTLIDMVRGLVEDAKHGDDNAYEAAEAVAREAINLRPGNGPAVAALFNAEAAGQLRKADRLRALRADMYLATLYQVELSHVPFPDEPPIRWPAPEEWRALSIRRKKWASVDLKQDSPAARRIEAALEETIEPWLFDETPLIDVLSFIEDTHHITIVPDTRALEDDAAPSMEEILVTAELAGITLRSALRIVLSNITDADLAYSIQDEVMKITTLTALEEVENSVTRVYPVADLIIPPQVIGGGGQGGQGGGGLGGQQGGQGGGGQFGGGGGGGQFGGGGGGFFSIPDESLPLKFSRTSTAPAVVQQHERSSRSPRPAGTTPRSTLGRSAFTIDNVRALNASNAGGQNEPKKKRLSQR